MGNLKLFTLTLVFSLSVSFLAAGQNCASTSIVLSSQSDVDNFVANYGCSIPMDLIIDDAVDLTLDITNLNGLSSITPAGASLSEAETCDFKLRQVCDLMRWL